MAIGLVESRLTGITDGNTQESLTLTAPGVVGNVLTDHPGHRHHTNMAQGQPWLTAPVFFRGWLLSTRGGLGGARHSDSSRLR